MKSPANPRLIAISGPNAAAVYLIRGSLTVGRNPDNDICLDDETVTDFHMGFRLENGRILLFDRNSRNGIFINDDYYSERILKHGDRIKCGGTTFLYWEEAEDPEVTIIVEEELARNRRRETLRVDHSSRGELAAFYRMVSRVFVRLVEMFDSISDVEQIQARVLQCAFEVMPARRGAIFLNGAGVTADDFASRFYREPESDEPKPFSESGKLLRRVYEDRSGHFDNEVPAICAPLIVRGAIRGALYIEGELGRVFEPEDLVYLRGIAGMCVKALNLSRKIETQREEGEILRAQLPAIERKIIGETPAMLEIGEEIARAAQTDSPVLITGESGTGKELVARAIHAQSSRRDKPYVALNCAGLSDGIVQSELFGHAKGAFTGAVGARKGRILSAEGGTLFLDEIGDLKLEIQGLLLRFLQEGTFEPLGSDQTIHADVRIIAATNVDLPQAIKERQFRKDLFFRLNIFPIRMPALHERMEDIPLLANYFLARYGAARGFREISAEALDAMRIYDWPGNVREMENAIRYAVDHSDAPIIEASAFPASVTKTLEEVMSSADPVDAMTKILVRRAVAQANNNKAAAAKALGMSVPNVYRHLKSPDEK